MSVDLGNIHPSVIGLDTSGSISGSCHCGDAAGSRDGADFDILVARSLVVHGVSVGIQSPRKVPGSQGDGNLPRKGADVQSSLVGIDAVGREVGRNGHDGGFRHGSDVDHLAVASDARGIGIGCGDVELAGDGSDVQAGSR